MKVTAEIEAGWGVRHLTFTLTDMTAEELEALQPYHMGTPQVLATYPKREAEDTPKSILAGTVMVELKLPLYDKNPDFFAIRNQKMVKMRMDGVPVTRIADKYRLSRVRVYEILKKEGCK